MSSLNERKRKGCGQTNDDKKEEITKKNKKVRSRKRQPDELTESVSEKDNSDLNEMPQRDVADQNQDHSSTCSDENESFESETESNERSYVKMNLNETSEYVEDDVKNDNAINERVVDIDPDQSNVCKESETNNHDDLSKIQKEIQQTVLVKSDVLTDHENSLTAEDCNARSSNENLAGTSGVQNTSLLKNCDTEKSNNFEDRYETGPQQEETSENNNLINNQAQILSTPASTADGCVSSLKSNNHPISDCDTSNVRTTMQAENLSHPRDAEQQSSSAASIWQNVHQYNNTHINTAQCYKAADIDDTPVSEARRPENNEFQQEYNRLQNEDIISKMKTEEDHIATPENQQQQLLNQHVFERTQNSEVNYRNIVHTQPEELQVSYGNMFNEMAQRPQQHQQQQPQPHQYSHEQQFYQMRLQQQQQQNASLLNHHQPNLNLQDALQDEQLLAYLHHQQQQPNHRPQHDAYADLVMDEFHDDGNANASANLYKLQLSPAAKHENQDDGYETSAGDVLTPNSHSSSTHSGTPNQSLSVSQHVPSTSALALHNLPQSQQQTQHHQPQGHMPAPATANALIGSFSPGPPRLNDDPYKFHDETNSVADTKSEHTFCVPPDQQLIHNQAARNANLHQVSDIVLGKPPQKRRGRKKKVPVVDGMGGGIEIGPTDPSNDNPLAPPGAVKVKERKKHDRFNGMSEEEVAKRTLPDHLCHNLDIVIVGINPGLFAAYKGHHYAGPGNHFWKCLYLSGLTQEQMSADEDFKLMKYGIGFTNMVQRATKGSADLTRKEIKEGSRILLEKLQTFQPKIAVFNGKLIFEVFSGKKDFHFGRQPDCVEGTNTYVWVMPSSSARCAQLPRAADKVPFYAALKKFRDYLNGLIPQIDEAECVFTEQRIREMCEQEQARNIAVRNMGQSQHTNNGTASATQQHEQSGDYAMFTSVDGTQLNTGNPNPTENTNGGPGPPSMLGDRGNYLGSPSNYQSQPEKKKRGRPKKLKIQEIIDPNTGERIQIANQHQGSMNDYSNILNLSMVAGEVPKKKRGRPKKVKMLETHTGSVDGQAHSASTPTHNVQQQHSLFSNSPQNVNVQHMTGYGSPISPSVRGSATFNNMALSTPPLPLQPHHATERAPSSDIINSSKQQGVDASSAASPQSSLPPGSPNVCAVDFEPPNATVEHSPSEHELATALQQQAQRNNSFHQWMPGTSQQHFDYTQEEHQQHQQHQYQREQSLSMQMHQQQQGSPHAAWSTRPHQSFETTNESNQRQQQQQQHHHYLMNTTQNEQQRQHTLHHQQSIDQQQQQQQQQQQHQQSTDVASKSLSGLESLVDQIPTIAESEAAAAAAVESRLQALQRDSTPGSLAELQAEAVYEPRVLNEATGHESRNSSSNGGSNTPQHYGGSGGVTANGGGPSACSSPTISHNLFNNTNMHRHHSQASSAASSPHAHSQQQQQQYSSVATNFSDHNSGADMLVAAAQTPPSSTVTTNSTTSATTSHLFSNFSVSHLAASSCNSNSNSSNSKSVSDWSPNAAGGTGGTGSPYHHSNLMAAAAIQLTTSPHHQMYIDHHSSMHSHHAATHLAHSSPHQHHMQVNSFYPPTAQAHHHHPGMAVSAYGPSTTSQHAHHPHVHNAGGDYGTYGATAAHMIHMPSPNYPPYGYGTPPPPTGAVTTQNNYSSWNHHHHHPSTVPGHHSHHLSMFERLKPSDIGSYTGF